MKKFISINLIIVVLIAVILVACSSKPNPTQVPNATTVPTAGDNSYLAPAVTPASTSEIAAPSVFVPDYYPPPMPAGAILQVVVSQKNTKAYTLDALKKLPQASVKSGDTTASGPTLSSLLMDANISGYQMVYIVSGFQSIILSKDKINDQVIVGLDTDGSLFLAIGNQPANQWMKQINQIWYK